MKLSKYDNWFTKLLIVAFFVILIIFVIQLLIGVVKLIDGQWIVLAALLVFFGGLGAATGGLIDIIFGIPLIIWIIYTCFGTGIFVAGVVWLVVYVLYMITMDIITSIKSKQKDSSHLKS